MIKVERILVPIDFSEGGEHAIAVAIELGKRFQAKVTLMHAYCVAPMPYGGPFVWPTDEIRAYAQKALDEAVAKAKASYANCDGVLSGEEPRQGILAAAKEIKADLIVMGTHGRRGVSRFMLGSVAEKVVRVSPIPVLSVPPRHEAVPSDKARGNPA